MLQLWGYGRGSSPLEHWYGTWGYRREYAASEAHRKKNRERQRAKAVTYCRLCGKPIERNYSTGHKDTSRMHDECVYKDILETLKAGKPLDTKQKSRLEFRGYTVAEFKEENNIL